MAKRTNNEDMNTTKLKTRVEEKYKTEKCKVLSYNQKTKELDFDFKGYGVRLNNVDDIESDFVIVKYVGEIGKANFSCRL